MKQKKVKFYIALLSGVILSVTMLISSCKKSDSATNDAVLKIDGYSSSDEIATSNLIAKISFEDKVTDAYGALTLLGGNYQGTLVAGGIKGSCYTAASDRSTFITYTVGDKVKNVKSFTVSYWVYADTLKRNVSGNRVQEQVFYMLNGNVLDKHHQGYILGALMSAEYKEITGGDTLAPKIYYNGATTVGDNVQEFDASLNQNVSTWNWDSKTEEKPTGFVGDFWKNRGDGIYIPWSWASTRGTPKMRNQWVHIVFTYDASTSKQSFYLNGVEIKQPNERAYREKNDVAKSELGELNWTTASKFTIGGMVTDLGGSRGADTWALDRYTGKIDEFRLYNTALSAAEAKSLYNVEKGGL